MRIAVDARDLTGALTGVGRYLLNLLRFFPEFAPDYRFRLYAHDEIILPFEHANIQCQLLKGHPLFWKQLLMPLEQLRTSTDLFFVPTYSTPIFNPKKTVVTIHDLAYTRFPAWADKGNRWRFTITVRLSARFASQIIAVSEATRKEIIDLTGVSPRKVSVIYEGVDAHFRKLPQADLQKVADRRNLKRPFILYVGSMHPRRNLKRLLQAYADIAVESDIQQELILCGLNLFGNSTLESWLKQMNLSDRVRYLGFVSDDDLVALYNLADVFVYPSFYEGFGLPVLEAMSCGAPVITSNVTSLPEIAGDAALLVDPGNTGELANALKRILHEPALREDLIEKGFQQTRKFSWRTAAEETINLFAKAMA